MGERAHRLRLAVVNRMTAARRGGDAGERTAMSTCEKSRRSPSVVWQRATWRRGAGPGGARAHQEHVSANAGGWRRIGQPELTNFCRRSEAESAIVTLMEGAPARFLA